MTAKRILLETAAAVILALIASGIYAASKGLSPLGKGQVVACTSEAKICPDGSAVGRSGPNCEFAPCLNGDDLFQKTGYISAQSKDAQDIQFIYEEPGAPALTKLLSFDSASICSLPTGVQACDAFNAPLSTVFQGTRVRVIGEDQGAQLLVHRLEAVKEHEEVPSKLSLHTKLGNPASALAVTVTPLVVIEDSRCAKSVQCVWAGTVRVRSLISYGTTTKEVIFDRGIAITIDDALITLTEVSPDKDTARTITPSEYRFTFEVSKQEQ